MKKHLFTLLFLILSIVAQAQKVEYLVKPTLELDGVSPFSEGMATVQKNRTFAYLNNKGKQITPFQYNMAYDFYNGLAVVLQKGEFIFINKKGERVGVADKMVKNIMSGLMWVSDKMQFSLIDTTNNRLKTWQRFEDNYRPEPPPEEIPMSRSDIPQSEISKPNISMSEFEEKGYLINGFRRVKKNGKWGFLNQKDETVVPLKFDFIGYTFNEGLVSFSMKKDTHNLLNPTKIIDWYEYGFVDTTGKVVIPNPLGGSGRNLEWVSSFSEGLANISVNHLQGFINRTGKIVVPPIYNLTESFKGGLAEVYKGGRLGFINKKGDIIVPFLYDYGGRCEDCLTRNNIFAWLYQNKKWGGIDKTGKIIIPFDYDNTPGFSSMNKMIVAKKNKKKGFIDVSGKTIIPFIFDDDDYFSNGLIAIKRNWKWGISDTMGNIIVDTKYDQISVLSANIIEVTLNNIKKAITLDGKKISEFDSQGLFYEEGLIWVLKNNLWGALNNKGNIIIPFEYDERGKINFETKLIRVTKNNKVGIIDILGNVKIPFLLDDIGYFNGDLIPAKQNDYWGVIDTLGKVTVPFEYDGTYILSKPNNISQNIIGVRQKNEHYFFNTEGKKIPTFSFATSNFSNGLAWAIKNNKRGFIDKIGKTVIPFEYDGVYNFSDGLAWVNKNGQNSFIDKTGKEIISLQREDKDSFSDGLARVFRDGKYCSFIDKSGKIALSLPYDYTLSFSEGLAWVKQNNKWGCVDKTGKIVIPIQFDDAPENSYYFSEGLAWVKLNGKWGIIKNPLAKK